VSRKDLSLRLLATRYGWLDLFDLKCAFPNAHFVHRQHAFDELRMYLRIGRSADINISLLFFHRGAASRWIHHCRIGLLLL